MLSQIKRNEKKERKKKNKNATKLSYNNNEMIKILWIHKKKKKEEEEKKTEKKNGRQSTKFIWANINNNFTKKINQTTYIRVYKVPSKENKTKKNYVFGKNIKERKIKKKN